MAISTTSETNVNNFLKQCRGTVISLCFKEKIIMLHRRFERNADLGIVGHVPDATRKQSEAGQCIPLKDGFAGSTLARHARQNQSFLKE